MYIYLGAAVNILGHIIFILRESTFTGTGELYSCGWNKNGQLGYSVDSITVSIPRLVTGVPRITKVSCGWNHTLAITGTQSA